MNEPTVREPSADLLECLRAQRGDCPDLEMLLEPEALDESELELLERHLELCPTCAAIARPEGVATDDVTWRRVEARLDARERPWAADPRASTRAANVRGVPFWAGVAAAVLVVVVGLSGWVSLRRSAAPPATSGVVRGASIQGLEPVGSVPAVERFRWRQAGPLDPSYEVEVERDGTLLWSATSRDTVLDAGDELARQMVPGTGYRWRVVGRDADGEVVAQSSWIGFGIEGEASSR